MSVVKDLDIAEGGTFYGITENLGDIMVNDGVSNVPLTIGLDGYVLTADSAQPLGIKWASSSGGGGTVSADIVNLSGVISTNSTTPIIISDFSTTPSSGNKLITVSLTYSLSKVFRGVDVGLYKDGVLISNTQREVFGLGGTSRTLSFHNQTITSFTGSEVFDVRFNVSNNDTQARITVGNVVLLALDILNSVILNLSGSFSTNSLTPINVSDFQTTPSAGTTLIFVSVTYSLSKVFGRIVLGMYKDGVLISDSEREVVGFAGINRQLSFHSQIITTFTGSEVFTLRVNSSATNNDAKLLEGNVVLLTLS